MSRRNPPLPPAKPDEDPLEKTHVLMKSNKVVGALDLGQTGLTVVLADGRREIGTIRLTLNEARDLADWLERVLPW